MDNTLSRGHQRIHYVDVLRGLLMLMVILGHSIGNVTEPVNRFILSFHMPAFFILSGFCFKPKTLEYSTHDMLKHKSCSLVWSYFTFSVLGVALYWLMLSGTSKDLNVTFVQSIVGVVWPDCNIGRPVVLGFWFVYDLIWITFIYIITRRISRFVRLGISMAIFLTLYYGNVDFYFSSEIMRVSAGFLLFLLGDLFSIYMRESEIPMTDEFVAGGGKKYLYLCMSVACFLLTAIISQYNESILMYGNQYGNAFYFLSSSILGTLSFYCMARVIRHCKPLEFIGRNTLSILLFHFYVLMVVHVAFHMIMPNINNYDYPYNLLHFVVTVVVCVVIALFVKRFCPWMIRIKL